MLTNTDPIKATRQLDPNYVREINAEHRGYRLEREPDFFLWFISAAPDGARLPMELGSKFTNLTIAKEHIDNWLKGQDGLQEKGN